MLHKIRFKDPKPANFLYFLAINWIEASLVHSSFNAQLVQLRNKTSSSIKTRARLVKNKIPKTRKIKNSDSHKIQPKPENLHGIPNAIQQRRKGQKKVTRVSMIVRLRIESSLATLVRCKVLCWRHFAAYATPWDPWVTAKCLS